MAPDEIDRAFGDGSLFARSAFRLELLDEYDSPITRERGHRTAGRTCRRVRVVSEPLNEYQQWVLSFAGPGRAVLLAG